MWWHRGGAAGAGGCNGAASGGWGLQWLAVLLLLILLPPLFFFPFFCTFFLFFLVSSFLPPSLLLSLFFFFSPFFFNPLFPCFYRQKTRERDWGGAVCCRPSNTWKVFMGKWGWSASFWEGVDVFLKREMAVTEEEKIFFFPCVVHPGEEEDPQCQQNGTISVPFVFFSWTVYETAPFWEKCVVSFKRKR